MGNREAEMEEKRTSLEIIAPSVEEAVAKGLSELGLPEDRVEIEVLDSGSKGLFGLGFRQARVRLTIKHLPIPKVESEDPYLKVQPEESVATIVRPMDAEFTNQPSPKPETAPAKTPLTALNKSTAEDEKNEQDEQLLVIGREVVQELLDKMNVKGMLKVRFGEPEDPKDRTPLIVDIHGNDLSILIGPKAETLNALQYIAGLIIGKEVGHSVALVVDVEGYRARRSQQIRSLARRMADQAVRTGRRQVLEPMPANERRLVHIELRDHPDVTTESVGEDPRRKVTINPK